MDLWFRHEGAPKVEHQLPGPPQYELSPFYKEGGAQENEDDSEDTASFTEEAETSSVFAESVKTITLTEEPVSTPKYAYKLDFVIPPVSTPPTQSHTPLHIDRDSKIYDVSNGQIITVGEPDVSYTVQVKITQSDGTVSVSEQIVKGKTDLKINW